MKKIVLAPLVALMMFSVTGCNAEETRTVEWYLQPENKAVWEAKLEECRNNPGELEKTPNCINARKAFDQNFRGGEFKPTREPTFGFDRK